VIPNESLENPKTQNSKGGSIKAVKKGEHFTFSIRGQKAERTINYQSIVRVTVPVVDHFSRF
jgi:hypothetical protein